MLLHTHSTLSIKTTLSPDESRAERIIIEDSSGNRVALRYSNRYDSYQYRSIREGETHWTTAPAHCSLDSAWHHAMVFLGVIPPDDISHPPRN